MNPPAGQRSERLLNLDGPNMKKRKKSPAIFSYVKKLTRGPNTIGGKVIRIEIYDAEKFSDSESSQCKCDADLCIQHVVKNTCMDNIYNSVKDIVVKISDSMEMC